MMVELKKVDDGWTAEEAEGAQGAVGGCSRWYLGGGGGRW